MAAEPIAPADAGFLGHPRGLLVCFATELWERFSFYGMKALLFFYLTQHHGMTDAAGYMILGTYAGLAYALPVLGGMLADRILGKRKAVVYGGVLLVLGQLGMAWDGRDAIAIQVLYLSLALIAVGVGFLKPNISTIVGRLYPDDDPRRDAGFTIFYMGINLGAFASSLLCGWLGQSVGWAWGFGASGVGMLIGLVTFTTGTRHLHGTAEAPDPETLRRPVIVGLSREHLIYLGGLVAVAIVWQILQTHLDFGALAHGLGLPPGHEVTATELVAVLMTLGVAAWLATFLSRECTRTQRDRMIVLLVLTAVSALFWGLYEQTYGTWNAFADRVMDRRMFGLEPSAGQLTSVGALFIFVLSPIFAWAWPRLDRTGRNPSTPAKFGLGLLCAGASMYVLVLGANHPGPDGRVDLLWLVLAYFVLEIGEMVLSPIGLAVVTTLSVPKVVSLMMGVWFLASAFGEIIAGRFGTLAAMDPATPLPAALATFASTFELLAWIGAGSGVLMLAATPGLRRGMHGVH